MTTNTLLGTTPKMNANDTPRHMNVVRVTKSPIIAQLLTTSTANGGGSNEVNPLSIIVHVMQVAQRNETNDVARSEDGRRGYDNNVDVLKKGRHQQRHAQCGGIVRRTSVASGVRPLLRIALVAMLTFCLIIRKCDH